MSNLIDRINQHLRQNCHSGDAMKLLREASAELVRLHGQIEFQRRRQELSIVAMETLGAAKTVLKNQNLGSLLPEAWKY